MVLVQIKKICESLHSSSINLEHNKKKTQFQIAFTFETVHDRISISLEFTSPGRLLGGCRQDCHQGLLHSHPHPHLPQTFSALIASTTRRTAPHSTQYSTQYSTYGNRRMGAGWLRHSSIFVSTYRVCCQSQSQPYHYKMFFFSWGQQCHVLYMCCVCVNFDVNSVLWTIIGSWGRHRVQYLKILKS